MVAILKERAPLFLISSSGSSCDGHNIAHSAFLIDSQIVPQRPEEERTGASALVRTEAPVIPRLDGANAPQGFMGKFVKRGMPSQ